MASLRGRDKRNKMRRTPHIPAEVGKLRFNEGTRTTSFRDVVVQLTAHLLVVHHQNPAGSFGRGRARIRRLKKRNSRYVQETQEKGRPW